MNGSINPFLKPNDRPHGLDLLPVKVLDFEGNICYLKIWAANLAVHRSLTISADHCPRARGHVAPNGPSVETPAKGMSPRGLLPWPPMFEVTP